MYPKIVFLNAMNVSHKKAFLVLKVLTMQSQVKYYPCVQFKFKKVPCNLKAFNKIGIRNSGLGCDLVSLQ